MTDLRDRLKHEHPSDLSDEEIAAAQACPSCVKLEAQLKECTTKHVKWVLLNAIDKTHLAEVTAQRDALVKALDSLLDGLDANYRDEGSGLTQEEWDKRVKSARRVSELAAAQQWKEVTNGR